MGTFICDRCEGQWPDVAYFGCPRCHPRWAWAHTILLISGLCAFAIVLFVAAARFAGWPS